VGLCPTPRKLFEKSLTKNFKGMRIRVLRGGIDCGFGPDDKGFPLIPSEARKVLPRQCQGKVPQRSEEA